MSEKITDPKTLTAGSGLLLQLEGTEQRTLLAELERSMEDRAIEMSILELESEFPGMVNVLSPPGEKPAGKSRSEHIFDDFRDMTTIMAKKLSNFVAYPYENSASAVAFQDALDLCIQPAGGIRASLIGEHIDYLPTDYEPFYPLAMNRGRTKDYVAIASGQDSLQYEAPLTFGVAYNFTPGGGPGGSMVQEVSGSNTTLYPYFNATPRYALRLFQWASRLLNCIAAMKARIMRDLDVAKDSDLLTHFDAVIPNGTLYSTHQSHVEAITDTDGACTYDKFMTGSNHATRHRHSTGTPHRIRAGVALCDPEAVDDMQKWGNDQYTEVEVSSIVQNGFGRRYEAGGLVLGRTVERWKLLETPIEHATDSRRVRYFGDRRRIGYIGNVSYNNKTLFTKVGPQSGQGIDVNAVQRVTEPPGFTFFVQAWEGLYMQIINHFGLSKLNH